MRKAVLVVIAGILFSGAALAQNSPPANSAVQVTGAWARGTPGGVQIGAAYLTLKSATGDRLTAISTPVAQKAEAHTMTMDNGIMKMRALDGIDLPAGEAVTLKPGGTHIMLTGLTGPLQPGQSFPMTLQFAKSGSEEIKVEVEKLGAMGPAAVGSTPGSGPTAPGSVGGTPIPGQH